MYTTIRMFSNFNKAFKCNFCKKNVLLCAGQISNDMFTG